MSFVVITLLLLLTWSLSALGATQLKISVHDANVNTVVYQAMMDFVKSSLQREDIQPTYIPLPLERASQMVNDAELDGEMARTPLKRKTYPNILQSKFPLFYVRYILVHRNGETINKKNIGNLQGLITLNTRGIENFLDANNIKISDVPTLESGMKMVMEKRADYIIMSDLVFMGYKAKDKTLTLDYAKNYVLKVPLYFRLNKKHRALMPKAEAAFKKEKDSNPTKYGPYKDYFGF